MKIQPLFAASSTSPDGATEQADPGIAWGETTGLFVFGIVAMDSAKLSNKPARTVERGCSESIGKQPLIRPANHGLLLGLPEHLLSSLFSRATTLRLKPDEVLFLAGDPGDGCYRVLDGLLKVVMTSDGNERILAFLGLGAIVGEMAVIDRLPRCASVVAVRPAILSFVSDADFRGSARNIPRSTKHWWRCSRHGCARQTPQLRLGPFCRYTAVSRARYSNWHRSSARTSALAVS